MSNAKIEVDRKAMTLDSFDIEYGRTVPKTCREKIEDTMDKVSCKGILKWTAHEAYSMVPILDTLRNYKWRKWLVTDIMAGISVGMIHIPQGMGFALLAAVAPVYGLYATFWQVMIYMFLGHCRHLSVGTMAVISLMIGAVVERETILWKMEHPDINNGTAYAMTSIPQGITTTIGSDVLNSTEAIFEGLTEEDRYRSSVANGVSLIVGATMFGMGIIRLGILTTFMPPSFISGFTTAASLHITTTQLKGIFNVKVKRFGGLFNLPLSLFEVLKALPQLNPADLICSIICLSFLIFIKEFINMRFKKKMKIPVPADMIVVVLGTLISYLAHLNDNFNVKVVGFIPVGIPAPAMPNLDRANTYIVDGMVTGITSFAISISMVEIMSSQYKYEVDPNKELISYGLTYGLSSFFHCFAGAAAPPRCIVMAMTGGKTQVASFFTVLLLLLVLLVIAPVFRFLPSSCLSSIIIVALFPLYKQFAILPRLWKVSKPDLIIWIVTFLVSVIFDVSVSLGVGIVTAIFMAAIPAMYAKGYRYGTTGYADLNGPIKTHIKLRQRDDIAIFRYEHTLYYLTIKNFKEELFAATIDPMGEKRTKKLKAISAEFIPKEQHQSNGSLPSRPKPDRSDSFFIPGDLSLKLKAIVLDCAPIGYVDLLGINTLETLRTEFDNMGIKLVLADCNPTLLQKLSIAGLIGKDNSEFLVFPTVQDAVAMLSDDEVVAELERNGNPEDKKQSMVDIFRTMLPPDWENPFAREHMRSLMMPALTIALAVAGKTKHEPNKPKLEKQSPGDTSDQVHRIRQSVHHILEPLAELEENTQDGVNSRWF